MSGNQYVSQDPIHVLSIVTESRFIRISMIVWNWWIIAIIKQWSQNIAVFLNKYLEF